MHRLYIYHGSLSIIGAVFGVNALLSVAARGSSLPVILMALGGSGMVITSIYEVLTTEPADFTIKAYAIFAVVLGALLALLGVALQIAS